MNKAGHETVLKMDDNGVTIITNKGNNAIGIFKFKKEFFDEYEGSGEYGILISDITTPLKKMDGEITLSEIGARLCIESGGDKYFMPIFNDTTVPDKLPTATFKYETTLTMLEFSNALDKVGPLKPSSVKLYVADGMLKLKTSGLREMEVNIAKAEQTDEVLYISYEYLILATNKADDNITLNITKDTPLVLKYEKDGALFEYWIAPRVDGEY